MNFSGIQLPKEVLWDSHLKLDHHVDLQDIFSCSLFSPLESFFANSGKNIRPKMVELGLRLSLDQENDHFIELMSEKLNIASSIIEAIHAGSLIIDDIQDQSVVRRNLPTMHLKHGVPLALNAGNWLYFWALEQLKHLELKAGKGQRLLFEILNLMTRAHYGQALDLGVKIDQLDQGRVKDLSMASMKLKTGSLFSLALLLGEALNPAVEELGELSDYGVKLGLALQAYDDIGNFLKQKSDSPSKRHEDLILRRPTWVWAEASLLSAEVYKEFIKAVEELPEEKRLNEWIDKNDFYAELIRSTTHLLNRAKVEFHLRWGDTHPQSQKIINQIYHQLENAYVQ
jgi:geranylgeranyl pyrophosphate synthase